MTCWPWEQTILINAGITILGLAIGTGVWLVCLIVKCECMEEKWRKRRHDREWYDVGG